MPGASTLQFNRPFTDKKSHSTVAFGTLTEINTENLYRFPSLLITVKSKNPALVSTGAFFSYRKLVFAGCRCLTKFMLTKGVRQVLCKNIPPGKSITYKHLQGFMNPSQFLKDNSGVPSAP